MKRGDIVIIELTGEIGMLLDPIEATKTGYIDGWWIRLPDYRVVKFANFEFKIRIGGRVE